MKNTYVVILTKDGKNPNGSHIQATVQAESEYDAIRQAEKTHPSQKVASIKIK